MPRARRGSHPRPQGAVERLVAHGAALPQGWRAGDDEMGRPDGWWRRRAAVGERYVFAVPSHTVIRARARRPRSAAGAGGPSVPGTASRPGVRRWTRRPGGALLAAMGLQAGWCVTAAHDAWGRAPIGVSKARRSGGWGDAPESETSLRS